ncbi:DUF4381 domain-containing protein [Alteromonas sp. C1M14]|uniref:DUF4381 domain-containing protein n=1 Tax=Alteromonas sp. C1M14 TaxID=2841567 RepID=UPI001C080620|nr:DUF4381 domain-containing protein [Alteromonas sp. C1M14]MBU2977360.1 DUF4381 domain-containing protein [Alteromonas sp. C1M14]
MNDPMQNNPLAQLKGIHTPETVSSFPLAWGWWVIIVAVLLTVLAGFYLWHRHRRFTAARKQAINAIRTLSSARPDALRTLNSILKRVSMHYDPQSNTAGLFGDKWHAYLIAQVADKYANQIGAPLAQLQSTLYQPTSEDNHNFEEYQQAALTWVKQARITQFRPSSTVRETSSHV